MKKMKDFSYKSFELGEIYEISDFLRRLKMGNTAKLVAVSNVFQMENGEQLTTMLKHKDYEEPEEEKE